MKNPLRSSLSTEGRKMAGARALWRANGMTEEQFGKPVIAVVNSFTQFVPGHVHLHEIGQFVKKEIEKLGCFAAEFNTIAIDDGIAMGHDGMLYSLPSRDIIADSIEYMVNAHKADAMICISNCDKITPGMLMAAMRLNIPTVFVSGGPMEAGEWNGRHLDLIDAMIEAADTSVSDAQIAEVERHACPGCGCCSGMFTANSMNSLNEAIGLALPGNGTIVATHINRLRLFKDAAELIVKNAYKYYQDGDASVLPRSIATRQAFLNAMSLDIAMGGSTNTVLHLLAVAQEAGVPFVFSGATTPTLNDIGNYVFLTPFGDDTCAYAAAEYMTEEMGLTKAYMLVDQSMDFTTTLAECFQERLEENGGEVVMTDNYMNKDPDFSAQIDRFLNDSQGAEVLFFASVPDDIGTIVKQFRDKGVTLPILSGDGADTPLLMEVAGDAAEGVLVSTHCSFENDDPVVQDFVTLYTETQGTEPENAFAALGYDCAHVIATAIEMCGDDVTPANVRDNLEQIQDLRCVTGVISYSAESHVPQKSATINVVENGAFSFVAELNP